MTWFSRLRNWQTDQANGIGIRSDYHDQEDDNFALGINECINYAGLNVPTANLPMGGFKHTGAANGTAASDYATLTQAQTSSSSYAADSSGTDAYAITVSPAITAYAAGQMFSFYPATANTGAASLNVSALGAKTIKKDKNTDLADNDIIVGQLVRVIYDGTNFQMLSPIYGQVNQSGTALYAADGGASDSYAITLSPVPSAYVTGMTIRFKANTANTGTASLNVNSLGAKTIVKEGSLTLLDNDIKASQIVEVIYDGTNFQLISPTSYLLNQSGTQIYAADAQASDTYVVTLTPAPLAYTTGMTVRFKANTLNTGTATLNVNSLGAITLKKFGTTNNLETGDILAGQIVEVIYDGTNFQLLSAVDDINNLTVDSSPDATADYCKTWDASATTYKKVLLNNFGALAASQAQMEAASVTTVYATPGRTQYHPGVSKAWVLFTTITTTAITASYNVTSLTDNGVGDTTINFTTAFSGAAVYAATFGHETPGGSSVNTMMIASSTAPTASAIRVVVVGASFYDTARNCASFFGDQ